MPFPMTLNDIEGHSPVARLFKCNSMNICGTFCTVSTDIAHCVVPQWQLSFLFIHRIHSKDNLITWTIWIDSDELEYRKLGLKAIENHWKKNIIAIKEIYSSLPPWLDEQEMLYIERWQRRTYFFSSYNVLLLMFFNCFKPQLLIFQFITICPYCSCYRVIFAINA